MIARPGSLRFAEPDPIAPHHRGQSSKVIVSRILFIPHHVDPAQNPAALKNSMALSQNLLLSLAIKMMHRIASEDEVRAFIGQSFDEFDNIPAMNFRPIAPLRNVVAR